MRWSKKSYTYICEECRFEYKEKALVEKCEAWCKTHKSCNIEITSYAIK